MDKIQNNNGDFDPEQLNQLQAKGLIPVINHPENWCVVRYQRDGYSSGVHYGLPTDPKKKGRYNDPSGRTGVCYTAEYAVCALAESYGRLFQQDKDNFTLGLSDLEKDKIHTLKTTRPTKTIDMPRLQGMLHLTSDQTMGKDTHTTQAIVDWAANTPGLDYDGVSYRSRHYEVGLCTAFWEHEGASSPLTDVSHCSVDSYVDSDPANFPPNWEAEDISGLEIVMETLQFDVQ